MGRKKQDPPSPTPEPAEDEPMVLIAKASRAVRDAEVRYGLKQVEYTEAKRELREVRERLESLIEELTDPDRHPLFRSAQPPAVMPNGKTVEAPVSFEESTPAGEPIDRCELHECVKLKQSPKRGGKKDDEEDEEEKPKGKRLWNIYDNREDNTAPPKAWVVASSEEEAVRLSRDIVGALIHPHVVAWEFEDPDDYRNAEPGMLRKCNLCSAWRSSAVGRCQNCNGVEFTLVTAPAFKAEESERELEQKSLPKKRGRKPKAARAAQ